MAASSASEEACSTCILHSYARYPPTHPPAHPFCTTHSTKRRTAGGGRQRRVTCAGWRSWLAPPASPLGTLASSQPARGSGVSSSSGRQVPLPAWAPAPPCLTPLLPSFNPRSDTSISLHVDRGKQSRMSDFVTTGVVSVWAPSLWGRVRGWVCRMAGALQGHMTAPLQYCSLPSPPPAYAVCVPPLPPALPLRYCPAASRLLRLAAAVPHHHPQPASSPWASLDVGGGMQVEVPGLQPGTKYAFRCALLLLGWMCRPCCRPATFLVCCFGPATAAAAAAFLLLPLPPFCCCRCLAEHLPRDAHVSPPQPHRPHHHTPACLLHPSPLVGRGWASARRHHPTGKRRRRRREWMRSRG